MYRCNQKAGDKFLKKKYNTFVLQTTKNGLSCHTHYNFKSHSTKFDNAGEIAFEPCTIIAKTFARCRNNFLTTTTKLESFCPLHRGG
jgi:hypothetical protein